jgi:hypothetical protein
MNIKTEIVKIAKNILSLDFSQVSKIQYEYRKKLFDLYSKHRDDKDDAYFKELRALEREQKRAVQLAAKEIYDEVKQRLGPEYKINGKTVENKYNFWLYKGNTGMKISVFKDGNKIMSLKCGRDIDHEDSGAQEKVRVVLGDDGKLNKRKDKDRFREFEAKDANDIINIYVKNLKTLVK